MKRIIFAAALALAPVCYAGTAAHAQSAPSDASLAQLQQQDDAATDAAQNQVDAIERHTTALVQSTITDLEHAGLSFDNMQAVFTSGVAEEGLISWSNTGQPDSYLGSNNEIAVTASTGLMVVQYGPGFILQIQPKNGYPFTITEAFDNGMVSAAVGNYDGTDSGHDISDDPSDYVAGADDKTFIAAIKSAVKYSLGGGASDSSQGDSSDSSGTDGSQASPPPAAPSDTSDSNAPPPAATPASVPSGLSGADRDAIGNHVRPCWTIDAGAPGLSTLSVELMVTTDATGTVRRASVAPQDQDKMSDPVFNNYANRAIAAVMNYQCATLPLPSNMLGKPQTFMFDFKP